MANRVEAMIITTENKAKFIALKQGRAQAMLEGKEKPEVLFTKDGRVLPIKDVLVEILPSRR
jgi:hypothetical protein